MSDQASPSQPQTVTISVGLGAQYIKDFSFENPNAPEILTTLRPDVPPAVTVDVNVLSRGLGGGAFESLLRLRLQSKIGDRTAFIAELSYGGVFSLPEQLPEEQLRMFLMIEAPRLLFPFARAIIANAVREAGFPNLVIQPIDFASLYAQQQPGVGSMPAAGAA
jgi:preprotein translocase subunit SecB